MESDNSILQALPHLDQIGDEMYGSCVIPVVLKALDRAGLSDKSLYTSVDLKDWITAGHISCLTENYIQV